MNPTEQLARLTGDEEMSGFTNGPWELCEKGDYDDFGGQSMVVIGDDKRIAAVHASGKTGEANARLIAAAPDLYDALEHIFEYWNRDHNEEAMGDALWHIIETAEAALAKARGVK